MLSLTTRLIEPRLSLESLKTPTMRRGNCFYHPSSIAKVASSQQTPTPGRRPTNYKSASNIMRRGTFGRGGRGGGRGDYYKNYGGGRGRGGTGPRPSDSSPSGSASFPQAYDPNVPRPIGDNGGTHKEFIDLLRRLDQKQYPAYRDIESCSKGWINDMEGYKLFIGRAQSDPYAKSTRCRVIVANETAKFPPVSYQNKVRSVALGDYLNRMFFRCCKQMGADVGAGMEGQGGWSGPKGGDIEVSSGNQHWMCYFVIQ